MLSVISLLAVSSQLRQGNLALELLGCRRRVVGDVVSHPFHDVAVEWMGHPAHILRRSRSLNPESIANDPHAIQIVDTLKSS